MAAKPKTEPEQGITLELNQDERALLGAVLQQSNFPTAHLKMLAASIQTKLED